MASVKPDLLFVYGTLRAGSGHPMQKRLQTTGRFLGQAVFSGQMFWAGTFPAVVDSGIGQVQGELYELKEESFWAELDGYEGCEEGLFRRERRWLRGVGGGQVEAWVYLYGRPTAGLKRIDSGDFFAAGR